MCVRHIRDPMLLLQKLYLFSTSHVLNKWEVQSTQMLLMQDLNLEMVSILAIPNWKKGNFLPVGWLFISFL
jgi:hypothetical protein